MPAVGPYDVGQGGASKESSEELTPGILTMTRVTTIHKILMIIIQQNVIAPLFYLLSKKAIQKDLTFCLSTSHFFKETLTPCLLIHITYFSLFFYYISTSMYSAPGTIMDRLYCCPLSTALSAFTTLPTIHAEVPLEASSSM